MLEAFFQPAADGGQRLYLHHAPPDGTPVRAALLYVHPWAEEMNKSRRMAAWASRQLASDGCAVLQIDLLGCGDSSGDFGDASWEAWIDDLTTAARWLRARYTDAPLWWWGLRAGALLAREAAASEGGKHHLLFWQPTLQGKSAWQQFLRLKAAAQLADGGGKALLDEARADVAAGRSVTIAGYTVAPALARSLENATLQPTPASAGGRLTWLELCSAAESPPSPAAVSAQSAWQAEGWATTLQAVRGPAFWQTTEIEDAPALIQVTRDTLLAPDGLPPLPPFDYALAI